VHSNITTTPPQLFNSIKSPERKKLSISCFIMSAQESTKCPFTIQPETNDPDKETKDRYITFETPIDPTNQNSMKIKQSALVTIDSDPEAIIRHEVQFERLRTQLTLNDAAPRKAVYEATLGPELLIKWEDACVQAPVNCAAFATLTLAEFNAGREQFVLKFMDRSIATNTKSWLNNQLKKPKSMTITDFTSRVSKICSYFPHMPRPRDTTPATTRIAAPDEEDQITILHQDQHTQHLGSEDSLYSEVLQDILKKVAKHHLEQG